MVQTRVRQILFCKKSGECGEKIFHRKIQRNSYKNSPLSPHSTLKNAGALRWIKFFSPLFTANLILFFDKTSTREQTEKIPSSIRTNGALCWWLQPQVEAILSSQITGFPLFSPRIPGLNPAESQQKGPGWKRLVPLSICCSLKLKQHVPFELFFLHKTDLKSETIKKLGCLSAVYNQSS